MSVKEAQQKIDSAEFSEWISYYRLEPIGDSRTNWILSLLYCFVHNSLTKDKKIKLEEMIPEIKNQNIVPKKMTSQQLMAEFESMSLAGRGTFTKGKK